MSRLSKFLNSKIITKDIGEETYLTWKETLSYALGRGAQGMCSGMTGSKYLNFFLSNIVFQKSGNSQSLDAMGIAAKIRLFCGIFDAVNDPIMGVIVDRTRTKKGQMLPYIKWAPIFVAVAMVLFFLGAPSGSVWFSIFCTTALFVLIDVTYTAFDIPMGALAFSITPAGVERTKLFGVSSIVRAVVGALPQVFVAGAALLPYFKNHTAQSYLVSACASAVGIILLTRITYKNTNERARHQSDAPGVRECFALLFKNKPLLMLFFANIFFVLCKIPEQVSAYFVSDLMFDRRYNVFIDIIKFPGSLLAAVIIPKIVEKLGERSDSRRIYRICCLCAIGVHLLFAAATYSALLKKQPDSPVSLVMGIVVVLFTGLSVIPLEFKNLIQKEMEAETVDYVEYKTGKRVEGIMLSIMSFTGKIENTFSASIGLTILGKTGYVEHADGSLLQNSQARTALFLMTTLVPVLGYLLMLIPMKFYSITGKNHREMMAEIMKRRAQLCKEE